MEKYFLIEKLSNDEFLIYNAIKNIPIMVDKDGLKFFHMILESKNEKKHINRLNNVSQKEYVSFKKKLQKINFFAVDESLISYNSIFPDINETKKTFYLHLTNNCNLKCKYCFNKNQRVNLDELSITQWKKILKKILPYAKTIIITGGEASLYKNIKEVVSYIKEKGNVHLELFSNACIDLEKKRLSDMLRQIDTINFSCDNLNNDDHERLGFNKELFLKNIQLVKKMGITDRLSISSVLLHGQSKNILQLKSFCNKHKIASKLTMFIPNSVDEKDRIPSLDEYTKCCKKYTDNKEIEDISIQYKTITCGAARNSFSIDAQGNVFPCQSFHFNEFILGNILRQEFEDIYHSPIATMLRISNNVNYKKKCKDCNIKYICAGGCVANTYGIEKGLFEHPKTLCEFYRTLSINRLKKVCF